MPPSLWQDERFPAHRVRAGINGANHCHADDDNLTPFVSGNTQIQAPVNKAKSAASEMPPAKP